MRLLLHDYSGHPFQVQLSRELARRGHAVTHWYCSSFATGHGALDRSPDDPVGFAVSGLAMRSQFQRYSPLRRVAQEIEYGRALGRRIVRMRPDVAVLCNTPLLAHSVASDACRRWRIPMVFWQQDVYSAAMKLAAVQRLGTPGRALGVVADRLERRIARQSAEVVAIADGFLPTLRRWGVASRTTVIGNWAPLPELPARRRGNAWGRAHGLAGRPVVLYAGTLGLKHDPSLFASLASAMRGEVPDGVVVVISEGRGRDWLAAEKSRRRLDNLILLDYQPYGALPDVLASADVLMAVLSPDASRYSVPSKVLTYLCAARPVVAVLPAENAAAATLGASGGAVLVAPGDENTAVASVLALLRDAKRRRVLGRAARGFAEAHFAVEARADEFEAILARACTAPAAAGRQAAGQRVVVPPSCGRAGDGHERRAAARA